MAFADHEVLLIGDPKEAAVHAVRLPSPKSSERSGASLSIPDLRGAIAEATGAEAKSVTLGDLAVDPAHGQIILSARLDDRVELLRVSADGKLHPINLDKVPHATKHLPDPPADKTVMRRGRQRNARLQSITDLAYFDGRVMVSGLTAGDSPSTVREFDFPFSENGVVTNVQIFHAAHGRVEEPAIQTFVPLTINGEASLLAGFTCTPLVKFPVADLVGDQKVRGTTVAELGNRNMPLDLIAYQKDSQPTLLMSNSARGVMKISTKNLNSAEGLTERVSGGGTAGQPFETIDSLQGVTQMDKLDEDHAVVVFGKADETQRLAVVELP